MDNLFNWIINLVLPNYPESFETLIEVELMLRQIMFKRIDTVLTYCSSPLFPSREQILTHFVNPLNGWWTSVTDSVNPLNRWCASVADFALKSIPSPFTFEYLLSSLKDAFYYSYVTCYTFVFTLKLAVCLVFLSAIRGGVPRYRYDFLTKMGWIKFLGLVLSVFVLTLILTIVW